MKVSSILKFTSMVYQSKFSIQSKDNDGNFRSLEDILSCEEHGDISGTGSLFQKYLSLICDVKGEFLMLQVL